MDWLNVAKLADDASYARGEDYARRGLVEITASTADSVSALARGTWTYDVTLRARTWDCTCPVGVRGDVCKHVVATALVAAGQVEPGSTSKARRREATPVVKTRHMGDVAEYAALVDSLKTRRFLDYADANKHGQHAHFVADELTDALTPGTAAELLPMLETGIRHMIRVVLRSDDSSGIQSDAAGRLIDLHARAAAWAAPDPLKLARWLVRTGFDEQDFWELDVVDYSAVLGERGLATYRKELDKRLEKDPTSFMAKRGLQRLAILSRDVAEIVRLVGGDLAGPHAYHSLVDAMLEAGHPDEALRYAREGLESRLVPHQTAQLYDATVRLLQQAGEHDEVLRLRREQLQRIPNESSYALLRRASEHLDVWAAERLNALDILLEHNPRAWVVSLLGDGDVTLAWEASRDMRLDGALELRLIRERTKTHPGEVFDAYVALIDATLVPTGERNYREAVAHLGELRRAAQAAGLEDRYAEVVQRLLEQHKRRPTLVAKLKRLPT